MLDCSAGKSITHCKDKSKSARRASLRGVISRAASSLVENFHLYTPWTGNIYIYIIVFLGPCGVAWPRDLPREVRMFWRQNEQNIDIP